jgi:hypothetical protein
MKTPSAVFERLAYLRRVAAGELWAPRRLAPLLVVAGLLPWLVFSVPNYIDQPLFRDSGMFQYVAWCIRKGERLYDTVTMPDGPFIYLIHIPIQIVCGPSDRAFRAGGVCVHFVVAAFMGALLAGSSRETRRVQGRLVWALILAIVWIVQVVSSDSGSQREPFYAVFGSLGLVLAYAAPFHTRRAHLVALFLSGFFPALVAFGKPSGVIYLGLSGLTVLLGAATREARWRSLRVHLIGVGVGVAFVLLFVASVGSLRGMGFWYFVYSFQVYRYLFAFRAWELMIHSPLWTVQYTGLVATVGGLAAVAVGLLPRGAAGICLAPTLQIAAGHLQRKGWDYQYEPVVLGSLLVLAHGFFACWCGEVEGQPRSRGLRWIALVLVFSRSLDTVGAGSFLRSTGPAGGHDVEMREQVATYLETHTNRDDRVFYFGIDPYTLYLAHRLPAIPEPVSFVLDYAPVLAVPPPPEGRGPDSAARARIGELQAVVAKDACARLSAHPPAAMVFTKYPPNTSEDPVADVAALCPDLKSMLRERYESSARYSETEVYLRKNPQ